MKIGFISLGCAKNRVDTEIMMGLLKQQGHKIVNRTEQAEVVIINTCGFLTEAKEEAVEQILSVGKQKEQGVVRHVIATGCMAQRHPQELLEEIPELDGVVGISSFLQIADLVRRVSAGERVCEVGAKPESFIEEGPRVLTTPKGLAYLKIAEGCNNGCSYCAIPLIRGSLRSRPLSHIINEAKSWLEQGIKELVIVAQDPASYGNDTGQPGRLPELLKDLNKLPGDFWIRLMYLHPAHLVPEMMEAIAQHEHVIPYLDIPIQHIADPVLRRMNRHHDGGRLREVLAQIKQRVPGLVLRTTVMVGFPGETNQNFQHLRQFVQEIEFDWLGAFKYSPEPGTLAAHMDNQVAEDTKEERLNQIMTLQSRITRRKNVNRVGSVDKVLISSRNSDNLYVGRAYFQAPEVDGVTLVKSDQSLTIGNFSQVSLVGVRKYDMIGEVCRESAQ